MFTCGKEEESISFEFVLMKLMKKKTWKNKKPRKWISAIWKNYIFELFKLWDICNITIRETSIKSFKVEDLKEFNCYECKGFKNGLAYFLLLSNVFELNLFINSFLLFYLDLKF